MILETHNIVKSYGKFKALDNISLQIPEGSIFGFLGPNGAGKTTSIRTIMGILKPDEGSISLFGRKLKSIGDEDKRKIGYVSQEQYFYEWMTCKQIGEFVSGFYPSWDSDEYSNLLKKLDIPSKRKIAALSVGMKLKLALALALAHKPDLLILDEPTSGLDPLSRREFLEIIRNQAKEDNRTTFFSSHIIDEVEKIADHIGIIQKGSLLYQGNIEELKATFRSIRISKLEWTEEKEVGLIQELENNNCTILRTDVLDDSIDLFIQQQGQDWNSSLTSYQLDPVNLEDIFISLTHNTGK